MKRLNLVIAILLAVFLLGLFPATAYAASSPAVIIGNSYTLESGQSINDNLFVVGGSVNLMQGSTVNGNVVIIGGSVQAAGIVNGNLAVLGGTLDLLDSFVLNGNLTYGGTVVNRSPGALINGQINSNENNPTLIIPGGTTIPIVNNNTNPALRVVGFFLGLFLWALAAMVVAMFLPNHLARISQTVLSQPLISGGLGLLTAIIVPILLLLLAITICLIPVSVIAAIALALAWAYGLIALGYEVGRRISAMAKHEWHPALAAGLGTLLLMVILNGLEALIPCVGWIPLAVVGLFGLGAVLLTQFGMKEYTPNPRSPAPAPTDSLPPAGP